MEKLKTKFMTNPNLRTKKPPLKNYLLCLLFSLGNVAIVFAQETTVIDVGPTLFKTFQRPDILKMTLTTATKQLVNKKFKEEWQPITLNYQDSSGTDIEWEAKVRTRGNIRKQVCYYPPLKLKFKKKWLVENGLDSSFNDLKLVVGLSLIHI